MILLDTLDNLIVFEYKIIKNSIYNGKRKYYSN